MRFGAAFGDCLWAGLYMTVPLIGPVVVVGHLAVMVAAAVEGAIVFGGLSALGAALYSTGIPKDSVLRYEEVVKADGFLVIVHGTPSEVDRARSILHGAHSTTIDLHERINMTLPAAALSSIT